MNANRGRLPDLDKRSVTAVGVSFRPDWAGSLETLPFVFGWTTLSSPVSRALDYLLRNYASANSVKELAGLSGHTVFQLIRAFRRELGITPHALLIRIRVLRAAALLQQGEPIAGTATDVGFVDQTHLARHFKRIHGRTPGEYSRMHAGHPQQRKRIASPTHGRFQCSLITQPEGRVGKRA
jgi:AraC-like DNA-binding protein